MSVSVLFFIGLAVAFLIGVAVGVMNALYIRKSLRKNNENWGMQFSYDGTKLSITDPGGTIHEYNLSTPWEITSVTYVRSIE